MKNLAQGAPPAARTPELVPVFTDTIGGVEQPVCDARILHTFLENRDEFAHWIKDRINKYEFQEDQDFALVRVNSQTKGRGGDRRSKDYHITLDMAKELCMVENNPRGREARRYFIAMERQALAAASSAPAPLPPRPTPVARRPSKDAARRSLLIDWWASYRTQPVLLRDLVLVAQPVTLAALCSTTSLVPQMDRLARLLVGWSGHTIEGFRVCQRPSGERWPRWFLEPVAAEHVEPVEPVARSRPLRLPLPPLVPRDPAYLPGVRRAINRRAQQLSRDCFRQRRQAIDAWLRQHCQSETPAAVIARIAQLQLADLADGAAEMPRSGSHGAAPGASPRSADLPAPGYYTGARPSALPFVADLGMWCVPPATDFIAAHARGMDYAREVAAYLRDNREFAGGNLLFQILRAIAASGGFADDGPDKGYAAGFCSGIEMWAVAG